MMLEKKKLSFCCCIFLLILHQVCFLFHARPRNCFPNGSIVFAKLRVFVLFLFGRKLNASSQNLQSPTSLDILLKKETPHPFLVLSYIQSYCVQPKEIVMQTSYTQFGKCRQTRSNRQLDQQGTEFTVYIQVSYWLHCTQGNVWSSA